MQDEQAVVEAARRGDADAFARLYDQYVGPVYRYLLLRAGNAADAEDLTEEVFLRALESINSFRWKGAPFSAWLFRIARNLAVDRVRRDSRASWVPLEEAGPLTGSLDLVEEVDRRLTAEQLATALARLTRAQREVLILRFATDQSIRETAQAVGKKENAVKALQHAGLRALRRVLESQGPHYQEATGATGDRQGER